MAGVQVDGLQLTSCVCTNSSHEAKGFGDRGDDVGVLDLKIRIVDMSKTPVKRAMEICNARRERGSNEVQRGCRMKVCATRY
jgi:hypothetical protein